MRTEAMNELSGFFDSKNAMTNSTAKLVDVDIDMDPERSADPENKDKQKFEIQPRFESNTPFITPEMYGRLQDGEKIIEEGQLTQTDKTSAEERNQLETDLESPQLEAVDKQVSTERDAQGKLTSVSSEALGARITFSFGKDGHLTRTTRSNGTTDTTTFDASGKAIHNESLAPDGKRVNKTRSPNDYAKSFEDSNGNPAAIVSNQNGIKTVLELGADGNVKTRSIEVQDRAIVTDFDSNGDQTRNSVTVKDKDGKTAARTVTDKDGQLSQKFDSTGKETESEYFSVEDNSTTTTRALLNGGTMIVIEDDASSTVELKDRNGNTRMMSLTSENGQKVETDFYNEDGSTLSTVETPDEVSTMLERSDGSWESTQKEKRSGHARTFVGKNPDDEGVEQFKL